MKTLDHKGTFHQIRMKYPMHSYPIVILVMLMLSACQPAQTQSLILTPTLLSNVTAAPKSSLVRDWLTGQPCKPPCFLGIRPGQSSPEEILSLLRKNPNVSEISDSYSDPKSVDTLTNLRWKWSGSPSLFRGHWDGYIDFDESSHRPFYIGVNFPESFTLKQVLDAYGEPSHVFAGTFHGVDTPTVTEYDFQLVWLEQGFGLGWTKGLTEPIISPEANSYYLFFFEPTLKGYVATWQYTGRYPTPLNQLTPWRGMLSFSEYCTTCQPSP